MTAWKPAARPARWHPLRGQICLAALHKQRPVIVISSDLLNNSSKDVCVLPISTAEHRAFSVRPKLAAGEGGLARDSWVKCDQPTTLEQADLLYPPLGVVSKAALRIIEDRVTIALDLS